MLALALGIVIYRLQLTAPVVPFAFQFRPDNLVDEKQIRKLSSQDFINYAM
jgi:hypothetical protein